MIDDKKLKEEYKELQKKLSNPELSLDRKEYGELSKRVLVVSGGY